MYVCLAYMCMCIIAFSNALYVVLYVVLHVCVYFMYHYNYACVSMF